MALSHDLPIYLATMKLLSLTIEKTQNQYNIAGLDSNAIRLNSSWTW